MKVHLFIFFSSHIVNLRKPLLCKESLNFSLPDTKFKRLFNLYPRIFLLTGFDNKDGKFAFRSSHIHEYFHLMSILWALWQLGSTRCSLQLDQYRVGSDLHRPLFDCVTRYWKCILTQLENLLCDFTYILIIIKVEPSRSKNFPILSSLIFYPSSHILSKFFNIFLKPLSRENWNFPT